MGRYSTVSRLIGGESVALCVCGWMGPARTDRAQAYRDRAVHSRTHGGEDGGSERERPMDAKSSTDTPTEPHD